METKEGNISKLTITKKDKNGKEHTYVYWQAAITFKLANGKEKLKYITGSKRAEVEEAVNNYLAVKQRGELVEGAGSTDH
ncbi:hypothetical protein M7775_03400 [Sporomusa sphaeroides DSM 2875]|uniref:hypothetical protein n=1 Tax=Sporomusa sphaeroides TaxID=47679 RepID=UPI00202E6A6F|nr:hypothetical protein [Sporomusa sphaeroides]MCM0757615.1 hypothetical protein [Sporomusa sphaeroides DSM 2875]